MVIRVCLRHCERVTSENKTKQNNKIVHVRRSTKTVTNLRTHVMGCVHESFFVLLILLFSCRTMFSALGNGLICVPAPLPLSHFSSSLRSYSTTRIVLSYECFYAKNKALVTRTMEQRFIVWQGKRRTRPTQKKTVAKAETRRKKSKNKKAELQQGEKTGDENANKIRVRVKNRVQPSNLITIIMKSRGVCEYECVRSHHRP